MANPEHIEILKQGVEAWNRWMETDDGGDDPDLSQGRIPEKFLRGCGLPESFIGQIPALLAATQPSQLHLERDKADADETAFTDAIYRTNQAFEGSLKGPFRVL